jgi:hypothetical protein
MRHYCQAKKEQAMSDSNSPSTRAHEVSESGAAEILLIDDFDPYVGRLFHFEGTPYAFPLDHIVCKRERPQFPGYRMPFTLIFRGPREQQVLPEGLYECKVEDGPSFSIYVAPIHTPAPDRQHYQAVFN